MKFGIMAASIVVAAGMATSSANAYTLDGVFNIDIYNFSAGSSAAASATPANVTAQAANLITSITYDGKLDFAINLPQNQSSTTINQFLASGSGSVSGDTSGLDIILSSPPFNITTFFDITANFFSGREGVIRHDDGITLLDDGVTIASSAPPTVAINTPFSFDGGQFRLIYAAANGNPSILNVQAVPLPAGLVLMLGALGCLGFVGRRRLAA